ncbi:MAG TPA: phosphate ABC transporter ATP-binding protein [Firmicutes bacterium]|nr:phosphate ABC transporter ATP-binding protein [Bacillota bacterium]
MADKVLNIRGLNAFYGSKKAVADVNIDFFKNKITAIMGPSGCGKTTFLRCINRIHEVNIEARARIEGDIFLNGENIAKMHPILVRRRIGMVFQKPNPFPHMTIYDNVIAGYRLNGIKKKKHEFDTLVEESLRKIALWDEVKDSLYDRGTFLSGGQQQRLCMARALAMNPDVILLDEPTSALDPIATAKIEGLLSELKEHVSIIIVTHNMAQAGRISDYTAFFYLGEMLEYGTTEKLFTNPAHEKTENFLTGQFG